MKTAMKTKQPKRNDGPVVPFSAWETPKAPKHLHIPVKRRRFRGPGFVPITSAGYPRCHLLWCELINGDNIYGGVVAALRTCDLYYRGEVVVLDAAGVILSRCRLDDDFDRDWHWHRARFIETAKAGLAVLRERSASVPEVDKETWRWVALQFDDLSLLHLWGVDDDDGVEAL
jgi:hypothetical protein